ncbi:hypothetical protein EYB45_04585 [Erythrobacteraceae bacterium CFH 75059]|uniref:Nmad3 family putative nucleotide modification protein n=1 Tax=Qipengyuania thermophila TaxID=2509361 RepID=UPI00101F0D40|nr:hypothetical protein [Qipengyuania thermophila]TCD05489.1 hypothetical protein EYB45_04585 [Erythrobacteraceae bacterium CFH 75059]
MRVILSRKGFDSSAGGGPSPIVNGRPVTLPIPAASGSQTTYGALGLGALAARASCGRYGPDSFCHHDPMFLDDGTCLFGQCSAAQTHLANQGVTRGDVFLFFGLFADEDTGEWHHRIFGALRIARIVHLASADADEIDRLARHGHPHALRMESRNDAVYCGEGRLARHASAALRLTVCGGPPSVWRIPDWLRPGNLTYHGRADRWLPGSRLRSAPRGQEFVADLTRSSAGLQWLRGIIAEINRS